MRRILSAALFGLATALATGASSGAELPKTLKIGTEGAYPPFNYTDAQGQVGGFEVDLGKEMCARLKIECQFVVQDWDGLIPGLLAKKYDAIVASLYITEERKQRIAFSDKYYQVPARFMVAKGSDVDITPEGLSGKTIATQRATSFEKFLRAQFPDLDLRVYATMEEAFLDLESGRVDAVVGDVVALSEGFLKKPEGAGYEFRGPSYTDPKWFGEGAGVGVRKEDQHLANAFSDAIKQIREDGTYAEIADRWFGFDVYGN